MPSDSCIPAVFYGRKSDEDDGGSVEQQREWALAAAPGQNIEIVREFADQAKKGHETAKRTAFHEMLAFCQLRAKQGRPVEAVVCWHSNRFSRSDSHETGFYLWSFRQAGVRRMFTARGWVDFGRMEDRLLQGIEQEASNHRYVVDLARDCTRGRLSGARAGRWMGGPVPYAYRPEMEKVTKKGRTRWVTARLVLGPEAEARVVRQLFLDYANTPVGLRGLAQRLTAAGVPAPRGGKKGWGTNTIKRILKNPAYLGRLVWARRAEGKFFGVVNAELVPLSGPQKSRPNDPAQWVYAPAQTHEPLVDLATWEKCQQKLARRRTERQPRLGCYALSGLVRCGHCDGNMVARVDVVNHANGKTHTYRRVLCGTYNRCGSPACEYNAVDADALTRAVVRKLQQHLFSPGALEALRQEARRQAGEGAAGGKALAALEDRLAQLARGIERQARRFLEEEDDSLVPALRKQLQAAQREHDELARQVEAARRHDAPEADPEAVVAEVMAMGRQLEEAVAAEAGDLLREALGRVVSYVELFFDHAPTSSGKRVHSTFAKALIYLGPKSHAEYTGVNGPPAPCRKTTSGYFSLAS
jgi:DNA invertase Pin-like site-specific DNA recombinase